MQIVHVVSGLAPDHRFGGISRVALDLARLQQRRGHQVHIVSSDIGFERPAPRAIEGVRVSLLRSRHLLPSMGFGTIVSPGLAIVLLRLLRRADLVHVHLAREPNTLLAGLIAQRWGAPLVLQTHGMLDAASNRVAQVVDAVMTSPLLRRATTVLTLTAEEDAEVARLSSGAVRAQRFPNGIAMPPGVPSEAARGRVVFLARLHPRKGAVEFTDAAVRIAGDLPGVRFTVAGPDEGDAAAVRGAIARDGTDRVRYVGPVDHDAALDLLAGAALYCLPAVGEPFGLTVIEALAAATPVLIHRSAALAAEIIAAEAGWTFDASDPASDTLETTLRRLLADPDELRRRGRNARSLVEDRYSIERVGDRLETLYRSLLRNAAVRTHRSS